MIRFFLIGSLILGNDNSNIVKKEISLPYQEREIYIVYDPLNISKLSLDIIQEMLNFKNV